VDTHEEQLDDDELDEDELDEDELDEQEHELDEEELELDEEELNEDEDELDELDEEQFARQVDEVEELAVEVDEVGRLDFNSTNFFLCCALATRTISFQSSDSAKILMTFFTQGVKAYGFLSLNVIWSYSSSIASTWDWRRGVPTGATASLLSAWDCVSCSTSTGLLRIERLRTFCAIVVGNVPVFRKALKTRESFIVPLGSASCQSFSYSLKNRGALS